MFKVFILELNRHLYDLLQNNINFNAPRNAKLTNKELGELITEATVYLECQMTKAKIEKIIDQEEKAEKAKKY